jgi:glutamate-ammonia-ligase adenylyltransferase
LRARHGAGDPVIAAAFLGGIDALRYPQQGLNQTQITQIRRLKARMETERIPRGIDPRDHVKLGPGGLSDVEWTVQLLQLNHAGHLPNLRVTSTLRALAREVDAGLIAPDEAECLRQAFWLASRIRNAILVVRNKASDLIPANAGDLAQIAAVLGYDGGSYFEDDWYRVARRAKVVTDRIFWGE